MAEKLDESDNAICPMPKNRKGSDTMCLAMKDGAEDFVANTDPSKTEFAEPIRAGFEWKKCLSGALSDKQLYLAMFALSFFYFGYTVHNAFIDGKKTDEGDIIRNCTCEQNHKIFYVSWIVICFILWLCLHSWYTLTEAFPKISSWCKRFFHKRILDFEHSRLYNLCFKPGSIDTTDSPKDDDSDFKKLSDRHIGQCKKFLLLRTYETYAIGIKKRNEKLNLHEVKKLIKISLSRDFCKKESERRNTPDPVDSIDNANNQLVNEHSSQKCKTISFAFFHGILVILRFIVQLSVVPLLIVQMFNNYTLLCLFDRNYCNRTSHFRLHLDQTALSFAFYCSLMISLLVITSLNLVPWPRNLKSPCICKCSEKKINEMKL